MNNEVDTTTDPAEGVQSIVERRVAAGTGR